MDEAEMALVRRAQAGDTDAFDSLARKHEARLLAAIMAVLGNRTDAYDAYQETLVRAFRKLRSFRFDSAFSTWMTRIAIRQALNWRRSWKGDRYRSLDDERSDLMETNGSAADRVQTAELREAIETAMEALSGRERTVFLMKHEHGLKLREIALLIECTEGTAKSYLFRAIHKLRTALSQEREWT
jgi:RNA polymerase sigma-70 factor (ECF subfamily)